MNNLQIINNQPIDGVKKKFGVCTKQLNYPNRDFAIRLIEWVEMLKILGVEKIYGYNRYVHPDIFKVMQYFEEKGVLEVKAFLEPSETPYIVHDWPVRTLELNLLNDCFYRTKNIYKHVAVLDLDEIIMPAKAGDRNWHDIVSNIPDSENRDYINVPFFFFPHNDSFSKEQNIPAYLHMLQHVQVSKIAQYMSRNCNHLYHF